MAFAGSPVDKLRSCSLLLAPSVSRQAAGDEYCQCKSLMGSDAPLPVARQPSMPTLIQITIRHCVLVPTKFDIMQHDVFMSKIMSNFTGYM